jgi:hypothetical protein
MAERSNETALAIALQPTPDVFPTFSAADRMPISALRPTVEGVTIQNDEYTGSVIKNADTIAGKRASMTFNVKIRPPGGADVPEANAYLPGRLLQAAKFTEVLTASEVPAGGAEALTAGTTTGATLGTGAAATADLYKGMAILLGGRGATFREQLSAIRSYGADKVMELVETLGSALSGDYLIPKQLSYMRSTAAGEPARLAFQTWFGGDRWDWINCGITSLVMPVPVSTKDQAQYPEWQVTIEGDIYASATEATPAIPALGAIPLFKDGRQWLAHKAVGGSQFSIDLGIESEAPPNPNQPSGSEAPVLAGSTARVSINKQRYKKSVQDIMALADAQANHPFFAQWGLASGNIVQVVVPDGRFNYPSPDLGGLTVSETVDLMIDAVDRSVVINFPYGAALT